MRKGLIVRCDGRNHNLTAIYHDSVGYDCVHVVRWCTRCGAVVIDLDTDGRVDPGAIAKMLFPSDIYGGEK